MSSPVLGSATARIVGRRRCSRRLAFYDLRELADVDPAAREVLDAHFGTEDTAAAPRSVELVAKADSAGFADEAALSVAQKECLKLGNVVRVHGAWRVCESKGAKNVELACHSVTVVRAWADAHPGVHFQKPTETPSGVAAFDASRQTTTNGNDHSASIAFTTPCKFWLNQGACHKGEACRYAHAGDRAAESKKWIEARKRRRRALAIAEGDPHGLEDDNPLATKAHRASKFAEWLVNTFGVETLSKGSGVLDVAGGRGDVSWELHTVRGVPCTLVEPRARKLNRLQHKWLRREGKKKEGSVSVYERETKKSGGEKRGGQDKKANASGVDGRDGERTTKDGEKARRDDDDDDDDDDSFLCPQVRAEFRADTWSAFAECSVVVGMHPDQATESIMAFAKAHGKPFAIVPCCVFPALFPDRRVPADEEDAEEDVETEEGDEKKIINARHVPVTRLAQLVRYLARETGGRVTHLDFQGANRVVYSTEPPRGFRTPASRAEDE
jgi:hypothetical protein